MTPAPLRSFQAAEAFVQGDPAPAFADPICVDWDSLEGGTLPGFEDEQSTIDDLVGRDAIEPRCALVLVDEDRNHRFSLDVTFTERVLSAHRALLVGSDASGSFRMRLKADLRMSRSRLHMQFRPTSANTPADLLRAIGLFEALDPALRLGLLSRSTSRWVAEPVPVTRDHPTLPEGYVSTVRMLARIQSLTNHRFPMPPDISENDVRSIQRANALLTGETITGTWTSATIALDAASVELIRSESPEHGALLEFLTEYAVDIWGHRVLVGTVAHRLMEVYLVDIAPAHGEDLLVVLAPGENNAFEVRLADLVEPIPDAGEARRLAKQL